VNWFEQLPEEKKKNEIADGVTRSYIKSARTICDSKKADDIPLVIPPKLANYQVNGLYHG
jgi:hypothetical protein